LNEAALGERRHWLQGGGHKEAACVLPDGHGELSGGALALSHQEGAALSLPEATLRHAARNTTGEPAGRRGDTTLSTQ